MEPYVQKPDPDDHEDALRHERDLLNKYAGLKVGVDCHVYDVPIEYHAKNNYIHTIRCGDQNKTVMVMVHGYAGSAITFYRMFKVLSQHYKVYAFDMLGMGLSSRPTFDIDSAEKCIDFFVESMEKWREKEGITNFHLVGHSMGGYISGFYTSRYPKHVFKLSLLSPAGINKNCEEVEMDKWIEGLDFWKKMYMEYMWNYWKKKKTPQMVFKELGFFGRLLFGKYLESRFYMLKKEEVELFFEYMISMVQEPESSEKALHSIYLPPRATAYLPLEDHLRKMKIPVDLYFGTRDWIDCSGPQRFCDKSDGRCRVLFIPFAGHQLIIENPTDTTDYMICRSEKWLSPTLAPEMEERNTYSTMASKEVSSPQLIEDVIADKLENINRLEMENTQVQVQVQSA